MRITINEGCTTDGIDIDGIDFNDFSKTEQLELLQIALNKVSEGNYYRLLRSILQECDDHEIKRNSYDCDQCGDTAITIIYEI